MAKNEIESIEEKIKKLKEDKKKIEQKRNLAVGKALIKSWGVEDEETALMLIEELKPAADKILNKDSDSSTESVSV